MDATTVVLRQGSKPVAMADGCRTGITGRAVCHTVSSRLPLAGSDTGGVCKPAVLHPLLCPAESEHAEPATTGAHTADRVAGRTDNAGNSGHHNDRRRTIERSPADERHAGDEKRRDDGQRVLHRDADILYLSAADRAAPHATGSGKLLRPREEQSAELDAVQHSTADGAGTDGAGADILKRNIAGHVRSAVLWRHILPVAAVYWLYTHKRPEEHARGRGG